MNLNLDPEQQLAADALQRLCGVNLQPATGWLTRWLKPQTTVRGVYLYGGAGRGKTTLAQHYFNLSPTVHKKHLPLHALMRAIHADLKIARGANAANALAVVAQQHAAPLLYIDEFEVNDIADAMLWGRLLAQWQSMGVRLLITSNRHPNDLYLNGLNRELFLPAIALLHSMTEVIGLTTGADYRLQKILGQRVYYDSITDAHRQQAEQLLQTIAGHHAPHTLELQVNGRTLHFANYAAGTLRVSFKQLCGVPLGTADYAALAQQVHTLYIDDVPQMNEDMRNEAIRFRTLIDVWYEQRKLLLCVAAAPHTQLYNGTSAAFEFARTSSRLQEMQSAEYIRHALLV